MCAGEHVAFTDGKHACMHTYSDICAGTHASLGICVRDTQYPGLGNTRHYDKLRLLSDENSLDRLTILKKVLNRLTFYVSKTL